MRIIAGIITAYGAISLKAVACIELKGPGSGMLDASAVQLQRQRPIQIRKVSVPPTDANGKICYLEIPATDIQASSKFYQTVFGWSIRTRGDGHLAFDDTTGQVSGSWVKGRTPGKNVGILTYIMVDSAEDACAAIIANGGSIIQPIGADAPEITARFTDPAGNVMGLYQQRGRR